MFCSTLRWGKSARSWATYPIPRRCVASYFPEANVLVPLGSADFTLEGIAVGLIRNTMLM